MNRKKSRETAMKLLFQMTINKEDIDETITRFRSGEFSNLKLENLDMDYILRVVRGVQHNIKQLDEKIQLYLKKWKINRISKIDITILRICTYEFIYENDIPKNVSINEAIELAKIYGEDKSTDFINGILGNMIKDI